VAQLDDTVRNQKAWMPTVFDVPSRVEESEQVTFVPFLMDVEMVPLGPCGRPTKKIDGADAQAET
jgi:hypothetical protein